MLKRQNDLVDLKEAEFKRGDRPDGSAIGAYRSRSYSIFKRNKNPLAGGDVDLILTGAFVNSAFPKSLGSGRYIFGFRDYKSTSLLERYGSDISGLNQKTFTDWQIKTIKPIFIEKIRKQLGQI